MDSFTDQDRKRKAEEEINNDIVSKKILLEENEKYGIKDEVLTKEEPVIEKEDKAVPKEESSVIKQNSPPPVDTLIPFDRLIVLHVEATCDENTTNPAAVQVTKENSEIIGKVKKYLSVLIYVEFTCFLLIQNLLLLCLMLII